MHTYQLPLFTDGVGVVLNTAAEENLYKQVNMYYKLIINEKQITLKRLYWIVDLQLT